MKSLQNASVKYLKRLALLLAGIACALWLGHFCLVQTRGFALYKIRSRLSYNPAWEVSSLSRDTQEELKQILSQPFRFLNKGAQAYVFLSEDERYVIKFFKIHSLTHPTWLDWVYPPLHLQPFKLRKILEKRQALNKSFASYKIAYEELKEETGIVFLHLNKTHFLHQTLTLLDNLNIAHRLDLDDMEFLVQKKAELFYPFLERKLREKGMEKGKAIISQLVHYLQMRSEKEIFDKDPDLETNFGILDDKVVQIDIGRFQKDPTRKNLQVYHPEIMRITDVFNQWLKQNYPLLSTHLEHEIENL
ncbi:MAG TPA: hypothetical protein VGJ00_07890 [Rhabdochlamydiaceae bacterium]|jgi:hypothetical protein